MRIVLASNSPRRKELLHQIFDEFDVIKSNFDEDEVKEKEPEKLVQILSLKKAEEVFDRIQNEENELLVIGGDTLVYFDKEILGKPKDEKDAFNTLKKLQGNKNEVYSAFTIIFKKDNKTIKENMELNSSRPIPEWLEMNNEKLEAKVVRLASREDVDLPVAEHLIVELYSK